MEENEDGSYSITLKFSEGFDWRQSTLIYDLPEGWQTIRESDGVTFICNTGNPDIGLVRGHFPDGSVAAQYWVKPNTFKIWFPDGWDESSAVEGKQAMITMAVYGCPLERERQHESKVTMKFRTLGIPMKKLLSGTIKLN